jgi:prephenate dehydrogenase
MKRALLATAAIASLAAMSLAAPAGIAADTPNATPQHVDDFQLTDHTRLAQHLYYFGYTPAIVVMTRSNGAAAADAALFSGRRLVITPLDENRNQDVETVAGLWTAIGARVSRMSAEEHDGVFATVSHLPHLLAYALVNGVSKRPNSAQLFGYAGGGFRDFTRIASSHPEMWRDICLANSDLLLREISRFSGELEKISTFLKDHDAASLENLFAGAREARAKWLNGGYE